MYIIRFVWIGNSAYSHRSSKFKSREKDGVHCTLYSKYQATGRVHHCQHSQYKTNDSGLCEDSIQGTSVSVSFGGCICSHARSWSYSYIQHGCGQEELLCYGRIATRSRERRNDLSCTGMCSVAILLLILLLLINLYFNV